MLVTYVKKFAKKVHQRLENRSFTEDLSGDAGQVSTCKSKCMLAEIFVYAHYLLIDAVRPLVLAFPTRPF